MVIPGFYDRNSVDDFVQKSLCVERLPAKHDQRPPDFAHTEPFT